MAMRIEGRKRREDEWRTVDALSGLNDMIYDRKWDSTRIKTEAETKLSQWNNHAADGDGAFAGWSFRLTGISPSKRGDAILHGRH